MRVLVGMFVGLLLVLPVLGTRPANAGKPPVPEDVIPLLGHEDAVVRREAARTLLGFGFGAQAALRDATYLLPRLAKAHHHERARRFEAETERVGRAFLLAERVAGGDRTRGDFWIHVDDAVRRAPPELLDAVLHLGLGDSAMRREILQARAAAADAVEAFVRDWNEMCAPGSEEEKRYQTLREQLVARGPAAVPPLLRVLETDPRRAFLFVDPPPEGEVSARMQVRAIFGLSFVEARDAIPHLVVHVRGPSLTAASNAGAALAKLAGIGGVESGFLEAPDLDALDAWWNENRDEHMAGRRGLEGALLETLRTLLAQEQVGVAKARDTGQMAIPMPDELVHLRARQAWLVRLLGVLTGDDELAFSSDAPVETRLEQATVIRERLDRAHAR